MKNVFCILVGLVFINLVSAQNTNNHLVDKETILKGLFGNYNKDQTAYLWITSDTSILNRFIVEGKQDTLCTEVLKMDTITVNNLRYLLIITQTKPKDFDCHSCAPLLGIVLFMENSNSWVFHNKYYLTSIGAWGRAVKTKLESIGHDKFGISFKSGFTGQGYSSLTFILFEITLMSSREILVIDDFGADNLGNCDKQKNTCWSYTSAYSFIDTKKEYFDLIVQTKGTRNINNKIVAIDKSKGYFHSVLTYKEN